MQNRNFPDTKYPEKRIWRIETNSEHPERIVYIYNAIKDLPIKKSFYIMDFAGGHGTVLNGILRLFPDSRGTIIDVVDYPHWVELPKKRTEKVVMPLQDFIEKHKDTQCDIVMMLNSFRLWDSSSMRTSAKNSFIKWLDKNAKYFITSGGNLDYEKLEISGNDYADIPLQLYKIK